MNPNPEKMTLLKWMTRNTRLSRRKAFEAIVSGQVKVEGTVVTDTTFPLGSSARRVTLNGKPVRRTFPPPVYLLLYKPKGVVTSASDPQGRATVLDLVKKNRIPIFPVGRLDIMTEGLLLLTNDGPLAHALTHPSYSVPRTYHVKLKGTVPPQVFKTLRSGALKLDGKPIRPVEVQILKTLRRNTWLTVTLREGRTREIRRIFAIFNLPVLNLIRVRYGPLSLKGLQPGQRRYLTEKEIRRLKQIEKEGSHGPQTR